METTTQPISKKHQQDGILFFIKYPIKGHVKSRLNPQITPEKTVSIYKKFVEDLFLTLQKTSLTPIICYESSTPLSKFQQWLGTDHLYYPQTGQNLGQRMSQAFHHGFHHGFTKLLIIGSDSPDLTRSLINDALTHLNSHQAVIGPSTDGGYYLLGLKPTTYNQDYFQNINWSTATVFKETLNKLEKHLQKIKILPTWYDIDTYEDLYSLYQRNLSTPFRHSKTMKHLQHLFSK